MRAPLNFRIAATDDHPAMGALNVLAYPWGDVTVEGRVKRYVERGALFDAEPLIVERAGRHVGQYTTIHFTGYFGGTAASVGGLAGVAVSPEARRSGVATAIVNHHLQRSSELGKAWSLLYPFAASFYARFGYATAVRRMRWRFRPSELPLLDERSRVDRLSFQDPVDVAEVQLAYDSFCIRTNGSLSRSAAQLVDRYRGPRSFVVGVRSDHGGIDGYLIATLRADGPRPQTLVVNELVAADDLAHRALIGFLAAQADQADFVELDAHPDDPLGALLTLGLPERETAEMPEEHQPVGTLYQGAMARLVDLPRALVERGYPARSSGHIGFKLFDPILADNCEPVTLILDAGQPRIASGLVAGAPIIRGPVGEVGRVLLGGARLAAAVRYRLVTVEEGDPDQLDAALALPTPYPIPVF